MTTDESHMRHALALAARGLGTTAPNPSVGCVVVSGGRIVGRGATQPGGRPHAETQALKEAGALARGAQVYVTLEPCAHTGQTGPCAQALIDAGVATVWSAVEDPDARVAGQGYAMLRAAGINVITGICADEARRVNAGFFKRIGTGRPFVTVKIAASLDGRSALGNGVSHWITGPRARAAVHHLRASHDAILTGIGTVLADDPRLDCRLPGMEWRSPVRFVADRQGRLPTDAQLRNNPPGGKVFVFTAAEIAGDAHCTYIAIPVGPNGSLCVDAMVAAAGNLGITRLLVEAGPRLTTAFIEAKAADEIVWFHGPQVLGADARATVGPLSLTELAMAPRYRRVALSRLGEDVMETFCAPT